MDLVAFARVSAAVSGLAVLGLAYTGRGRATGTARSFRRLLVVLGVAALAFVAVTPSASLYQVVWLYTLVAVPVAYALFAFDYYGVYFFRKPLRLAGFLLPPALVAAAGVVLSVTTGSVGAGGRMLLAAMAGGGTDLPPVVVEAAAVVQNLGVYYLSGLTLVAAGLVAATVLRYPHLRTGLGVALSVVGLSPWLSYAVMPVLASGTSWPVALAVVGGCHLVTTGAAALAVGRYGLFDSRPAAGNVGPSTAFETVGDPVFVVDDRWRLLRHDGAAEEAFGVTESAAGRPLGDLLGVETDGLDDRDTVSVETGDGFRQFEVRRTPLSDGGGERRRDTLVFRDVTHERTRQQRLEVLTRVLRHNLRNDLNVIRSQTGLMADGGAVEPEDGAAEILTKTDELISISERAQEAQRVVTAEGDRTSTADVETAVDSVVDELAETYPDTELTAAVPGEATASVDPGTLEVVLWNLVDNACEHCDADSPVVVVSAEWTDAGRLRLAISDNGPGIPEPERRVIESGTENPLEHGSGLGLWTVKWGVTQMGGTLNFADNTPSGTVVELVLPTPDGG